jgi:hypothetical protein
MAENTPQKAKNTAKKGHISLPKKNANSVTGAFVPFMRKYRVAKTRRDSLRREDG